MGKNIQSNVSRIIITVLAVVLSVSFIHYADASAQKTYLTRTGDYVGVKELPVTGSIDATFQSVGVPDQCRNEAHDILKQYIIYGIEDDPQFNPHVTILCAFNVSKSQSSPAGFMGKAIGTRGVVGGLKYIKFENAVREVERYTLDIKPKPQNTSSLWNKMLHFVNATPPSGQLACQANGNCSSSKYLMTPLQSYTVNSGFGGRRSPTAGASSNHKGVDLGASCGTPVQASADGSASEHFQRCNNSGQCRSPVGYGYGRYIKINHGNGDETRYAHLQKVLKTGSVKRGDVIGLVGGATGTAGAGSSTGCHLHFEYRKNGVAQEPLAMLGDGPAPQLNATQLAGLGTNIAAVDQSLIALASMGGGALNDGSKASGYCSTSVNGKCPTGGLEMDAYLEIISQIPPMHGDHGDE